MKLVTFGCSWIWGDELEPSTAEYRNSVNIGGLINKDYKFDDYINYGNNGASNERIILQILEYKNSKYYNESDFLVVGLSGLQRKLLYLNHANIAFTLPTWDYDSHIKNQKNSLSDLNDVEEYMSSVLKFEVNNRNDLVRYNINLFAIKTLLSSHTKYIVFQSIDNPIEVYDNVEKIDWNELVIHHDVGTITHTTKNTMFFNKTILQSELNHNLLKTQKWINLSEISWRRYLEIYRHKNGMVNVTKGVGEHPNEFGIKLWYEKVLSNYIKQILK